MTTTRARLERRNALWRALRLSGPGEPEFEAALRELGGLIGWDRARILAGLGLPDGSGPASAEARQEGG